MPPVYDEIVAHFGEEILDEKGEINRSKLADIVFTDEKELKILNGIVHPAVKEEIRRKIAAEERKCTSLFLIEAALLIEDNYEEICVIPAPMPPVNPITFMIFHLLFCFIPIISSVHIYLKRYV